MTPQHRRRRPATGHRVAGVLPLILSAVLAAGCAPDASGAAPLRVTLADDHITLDPPEVPAGVVRFEVDNDSEHMVHEMEVFGGAVDGAILPIAHSVADTAGLTIVDELEGIVPGTTAHLTADLAPGVYLVICNLPGHYGRGMRAYLTVTGA